MVTKEEFEHFISEFESLRDLMLEEITKIKTEVESIREEFSDLKKELSSSGKFSFGHVIS